MKVRAWDGKKYWSLNDRGYFVWGDWSKSLDEVIREKMKIEECSGRKDEDGKLVHQGDFMSWGDSYIEIVWDDAFVGFAIQRYFDGEKYGDSICAINFDFSKEKIIGNIRQNPELL